MRDVNQQPAEGNLDVGSSHSDAGSLGRRQFLGVAGAVVGGLALGSGLTRAAASTLPRISVREHQQDAPSTSTITVALLGASAVGKKLWNAAFAGFQKDVPGIKVNPLYVTANNWVEFFSDLETRIAGGQSVDAADIPTEGQRLFMTRGILEPLDPYIAANKSYVDELYADINPFMLKGFQQHSATLHGHTYYLPAWFNTTLLLYSKKLFHNAKVPEPSPNWTWADFKKVCQQLSNTSQHRYGVLLNIDVWGGFEPWCTTNGAQLMNSTWTAPAIDSPATIEAFNFCRSLVANKLAPVPSLTANGLELMSTGNVAMMNAGAVAGATLTDYQMSLDEVGLVPYPIGKRHGSSVGIGTFAMFKSSKNKDAVWKLIQWITNKTQQAAGGGGSITVGQLPIRTSASRSPELLKQLPAGSQYYWSMLSYSQFVPGTNNATAMEGAMDQEWTSMLTGALSPAACAKQMATSITKYL